MLLIRYIRKHHSIYLMYTICRAYDICNERRVLCTISKCSQCIVFFFNNDTKCAELVWVCTSLLWNVMEHGEGRRHNSVSLYFGIKACHQFVEEKWLKAHAGITATTPQVARCLPPYCACVKHTAD